MYVIGNQIFSRELSINKIQSYFASILVREFQGVGNNIKKQIFLLNIWFMCSAIYYRCLTLMNSLNLKPFIHLEFQIMLLNKDPPQKKTFFLPHLMKLYYVNLSSSIIIYHYLLLSIIVIIIMIIINYYLLLLTTT